MSHSPSRPPGSAGSVLILVIVAIVFLGALAAGVVSFLGTSNMDTTASNMAEKVYYNAESGYRYLDQRYTDEGDTNGNGFKDDDKANVLIALNGATMSLPGNLGSFTLDIRPYWFITTTSYTSATSITVRVPGSLPDGYSPPSTGMLDVEDNSLHAYTAVSVNAPNLTFTLSTPVTVAAGKSVYMTLAPTSSQSVAKGGSLTLSTSSGSIFPDRFGQILVYGSNDSLTYSSATFNSGSNVLTLTGLSEALSVAATDRIVLKKSAYVRSSGKAGDGGFASTNDVKYNTTWSDDTSSGDGIEDEQNAFTTEMNDLSNFTNPQNGFTTGNYWSSDGTTDIYVVTKQVGETDDPDSTCTSGHGNSNPANIRYATLNWNNNALLSSIWQNATSNHLLSYDVQAKTAWGYQLEYGAGGLSFRLNESTTSGKYNTLGLSFMKFNYKNSCSVSEGHRDEVPDSIKPTVAAADTNTSHLNDLADHCLLVLWLQEVSSGAEHRKWVAYRDIENELCIRGMQTSGDSRCATDDSTLMVRVVEKMVNGTKTSDISVYYGDASNQSNSGWWEWTGGWGGYTYHNGGCGPRTPNTTPYDYGTLRQVYSKNSSYSSNSPFPTFPPISVSSWNSTYDYFSFVENGLGSSIATWDRINPDLTSTFVLQSDGGTLRTTKFLSPSSGTFPSNRPEIGLHSFGGGSSNQVIGFKDFSIQILKPSSGSSGSISGAVMR